MTMTMICRVEKLREKRVQPIDLLKPIQMQVTYLFSFERDHRAQNAPELIVNITVWK